MAGQLTPGPGCSGDDGGLPPFAGDDAVPWPAGPVTIDVLANDRDPEGKPLTITAVSAVSPAGAGSVSNNGSAITFTPSPAATSATFTYVISDSRFTASAFVTVGGVGNPSSPPTADFEVACAGRDCNFRILTSSPFSDLRETRWQFGDGTASPQFFRAMSNTHTYAGTGTFQTVLTLVYFSGATRTVAKNVTVGTIADRIDFQIETSGPGVGGLQIRVVIGDVILGSSANDILGWSYALDWGDGTAVEPLAHFSGLTPEGARRLHVYALPGTYGVTVTAARGSTTRAFRKFVTVANAAPIPRFTVSIGPDQKTVTFDPRTSDDDQHPGFSRSHTWDFGDGTVQPGNVVEIAPAVKRLAPIEHVYNAPGDYTVKLTMIDTHGALGTATRTLKIANPSPPTASFFAMCHGRLCRFESTSTDDGEIIQYTWDFGDGVQETSTNPGGIIGHEFTADGCYTVKLTVVDNGLAQSTVSRSYPLSGILAKGPATVVVDAHRRSNTSSNLNGILEPGEKVQLELIGRNPSATAQSIVSVVTGVTLSGGSVTVDDNQSTYGLLDYGLAVPGNALTDCWTGDEADCYLLRLAVPTTRPAVHWDAAVDELSILTIPVNGQHETSQSYKLHIGGSFNDVPVSSSFYPYIETLLHYGLTSGCGNGAYCPSTSVKRDQIAFPLLQAKAKFGTNPDDAVADPVFTPSACTTPPFSDVPCSNPFAGYVAELKRLGVTNGCGSNVYCPAADVRRADFAVLALRTLDPAMPTPACTGLFDDLPCFGHELSFAAPYAEELLRRGISSGCGPRQFCPATVLTRDHFAVLLSRTFDLRVPLKLCEPGTVVTPASAVFEGEPEL